MPAVTSGPSLAKLKGGRRLLRAAAERRPRGRGAAGQPGRSACRGDGRPARARRSARCRPSACGRRGCAAGTFLPAGLGPALRSERAACPTRRGPLRAALPGPAERHRARPFAGGRVPGCGGGGASAAGGGAAGPRRRGRRSGLRGARCARPGARCRPCPH